MKEQIVLGDQALALGALHSGISLAYAYPGTPSTEILEYLMEMEGADIEARWCSNEKTAMEAAVGVSAMNLRVLVCMKHVGLNVAADPFMNSALMNIQGGLVLAVADDPGMHSSQNEQDSRYYADFAKIPCFEPSNQQEVYQMTRDAFDLSERFHLPVMVKLVTRLAHARTLISPAEPRKQNSPGKFPNREDYMVLPALSRRAYSRHLDTWDELSAMSEESRYNPLSLAAEGPERGKTAIISSGLATSYLEEQCNELSLPLDHLHIGQYPLPLERIRRLAERNSEILCIEEGYPFIERYLRGIVPTSLKVHGKLDGALPASGELTPDLVRGALKIGERPSMAESVEPSFSLPGRPPQLCQGCPHAETFTLINKVLEGYKESLVTSDIGCYTLGYLPPHSCIETSLCMGASIPMARGAADAGCHPVLATIGDSTFLHSGLTGLVDLLSSGRAVTLLILDNGTTAMTGGQDTIVDSDRLEQIVLGHGIDPGHCSVFEPLAKYREKNIKLLQKEIDYPGVSVLIAKRECVRTLSRSKKREERS